MTTTTVPDPHSIVGDLIVADLAEALFRLTAMFGETAIAHSHRFRKVCSGDPHAVAMAYDRDIARTAQDSDELVAANVAACERAEGIPVREWRALGAAEHQ